MSKRVSFHTSLPINERDDFKKLCNKYGINLGKGIQALIKDANQKGRINGVAIPPKPSMYTANVDKNSNDSNSLSIILKFMSNPSLLHSQSGQQKIIDAVDTETKLMYQSSNDYDQACGQTILRLAIMSIVISFPMFNNSSLLNLYSGAKALPAPHRHTLPASDWALTSCLLEFFHPQQELGDCSWTRANMTNLYSACEAHLIWLFSKRSIDKIAYWLDNGQGDEDELMPHDSTAYQFVDQLGYNLSKINKLFIKHSDTWNKHWGRYFNLSIDWKKLEKQLRP